MCGIAGTTLKGVAIEDLNACQSHRGPDDRGTFTDEYISLGHLRLAIQDLSPKGHQPMRVGDVEIIFNGEVYNFKELRKDLEAKGQQFVSGSDTEVIAAGYRQEGSNFLYKMRGMWALALYNTKTHELVLSRDPFGIKPLYVFEKEVSGKKEIAFSSELRALSPVLKKYGRTEDTFAHHLYFLLGYIPAPHTPFTEVQKMLPGEIRIYDLEHGMRKSIDPVRPYLTDVQYEGATAQERVEKALEDSIRAHYIADVPVCLFFSGGIDSTLLLSKSRELGYNPEPFFLHIPNRLDNEYAQAIAKELGVKLTNVEFGEREALASMHKALKTLDEPFADTSYVPTEFLSGAVAKTHKVVLSGEGGDEFFGGYHRHKHLPHTLAGRRFISQKLVQQLATRVRRGVESKINRDLFAAYIEFMRIDEGLIPLQKTQLIDAHFKQDIISRAHDTHALDIDQVMYLPDDLLFKIDRAGMQHGLEGRVPFLDRYFFNTVRQIPIEERMGKSVTGKEMLKHMLRKHLPENLIERPKQGFSFPLNMIEGLEPELFENARAYAKAHPELVPLHVDTALEHPQTKYALLVWAQWHQNFFK
jgi:asparagine synthase (glutamine-hydrolysing)